MSKLYFIKTPKVNIRGEPYYFEVEQISKHVGNELWIRYRKDSIKAKRVEGIPLTEEWLKRFGFEIRGGFYDKGKLSIFFKDKKVFWNSWFIMETPAYVHQLMNLFFALTQTELTIKEK